MTSESLSPSQQDGAYQVLARKYRPKTFDDLIGQEALVRTLSNAIAADRIAHAFLLTGIRGIGKTTTARIIARTLNCIGPDGKGGPTASPCGQCEHCIAITEDRHQDVIEMDAASRTGVGDIREVIDNARYLPASARYKVYIIDEVHMLSNSAFNALLKTLEEPPQHVKFIFATTEIRKIPITILSRCQRFDLRRLDFDMLSQHLANVTQKEGYSIANEALTLLTNSAEGSVRDGLSLLDQAIAYSIEQDNKEVSLDVVRNMLGISGKEHLFDLLHAIAKGKPDEALTLTHTLYDGGADPALLTKDLLELINLVTRIRTLPDLAKSQQLTDVERTRGSELAQQLSIPYLSRAWQMTLKGLHEVTTAPQSLMALEMLIIRLAHVSDLPSPAEYIRKTEQSGSQPSTASTASSAMPSPPVPVAHDDSTIITRSDAIRTFEQFVILFEKGGEPMLFHLLRNNVRPVQFDYANRTVELNLCHSVPSDFVGRLTFCMQAWTGDRWVFIVSQASGTSTLEEQKNAAIEAEKQQMAQHPDIAPLLAAFPGAEIRSIISLEEEHIQPTQILSSSQH